MNYPDYLNTHWWKTKSAEYKLSHPQCELCGAPTDDVHHLNYKRLGNEWDEDLQALCRNCHNKIHFKEEKKMETKTMTIKEIAELVGKGRATIQRWAELTKMSSILLKLSSAETTKKPAQFTRDEVLAIVEAGMPITAKLLKGVLLMQSKTSTVQPSKLNVRKMSGALAKQMVTVYESGNAQLIADFREMCGFSSKVPYSQPAVTPQLSTPVGPMPYIYEKAFQALNANGTPVSPEEKNEIYGYSQEAVKYALEQTLTYGPMSPRPYFLKILRGRNE